MEAVSRPIMFPDFGDGSCLNCGFLAWAALRDDSSSAREAPIAYRGNAHFPGGWPICFVHATSLADEMGKLECQGVPGDQRLRQVIEAGRHCKGWHPWRPGFDPQWHVEDLRILQLEEGRRQFEQDIEQRRQEFDLKLFEMSQKVLEDSRRIAERSDAFNRRTTWFFVALAVLEVAGTLLALAYPNGIQWLVERVP